VTWRGNARWGRLADEAVKGPGKAINELRSPSLLLVVETTAKVRRAYFLQKKPIKAICREFHLSRKVVRKVIRSEATVSLRAPPAALAAD
jgi:hypothetical protein